MARLSEIALKIVYVLAAVCTVIAVVFTVWWTYVTTTIDHRHQIFAFVIAVTVFLSAVCYCIIFYSLARRVTSAESKVALTDNGALRSAEQRIAKLESELEQERKRRETELPAARPKIVPVKWGKTADGRSGLILRNDGEPAFEITIDEPIQIGSAKLTFWDRTYPGLTQANGELLADACITLQQGSGTDGTALRDLMIKADISALALAVRYRGLDEKQCFVTKCDVICEFWGEGLRIGNVRQERL